MAAEKDLLPHRAVVAVSCTGQHGPVHIPRRYRLAPLPEEPDGQGALVWWDPDPGCWVSLRYLDDGEPYALRHERLAEVIHELCRDAVMTDEVLRALLADRESS